MQPRPDHAAALWRHPGFAWLLGYRIGALLSYQIVAVAVGWHLYQLTGSTFALGLVGLAEVLPYFCVAPFAATWSTSCRGAGWASPPAPGWH